MDYPATQMFFNDDDADEKEEEDLASSSHGAERDVKVGVLVVDSVDYPVRKGVNKVGRIESCDIAIDHNTISKEHAEIEAGVGSKSVFISDLGSLNKTKLNDALLRPRRMYQLRDGDVLRFGLVRAVFNSEENKEEKTPNHRSEVRPPRDDFIVPETPVSTAKEAHTIIPGTPDLSFEDATASRSSIEGNISSDISLVAGTQPEKKPSETSWLTTCDSDLDKGEVSTRSESTPKIDRKDPGCVSSNQDISELDTQTDLLVVDSDEENIFEMMTQRSSARREETENKPAADSVTGPSSPSINDLETQRFFTDATSESRSRSVNDFVRRKLGIDDTPESRLRSICDMETQKFDADITPESRFRSISNLETQKIANDVVAESCSRSTEESKSQKLRVEGAGEKSSPSTTGKATERSTNDAETQKYRTTLIAASDEEDSETDEEGLFADSGDGNDIFNAPTQLIISPDKDGRSRRAALEISSDGRERGVTKAERNPDLAEEETSRLDKLEEKRESRSPTLESVPKKSKVPEPETGKRTTLNDTIENNLNNMFDDVNDSVGEEPTQMLTQHLERILESTQVVERPLESVKEPGEALEEDGELNFEPVETPRQKEEESAEVFRMPEIMSTQELFADLPLVDIRGTPKKNPASAAAENHDAAGVSPSKNSGERETDGAKTLTEVADEDRRGKTEPKKSRLTDVAESFDHVVSGAAKRRKKKTVPEVTNEESTDAEVEEIVAVIHESARGNDRRRLKGSERSTVRSCASASKEAATNQGKSVNDTKKLPPKKRGFSASERDKPTAKIRPRTESAVAEFPYGTKKPRMKKAVTSTESDETPPRSPPIVALEEEVVATSRTAKPRVKATRGSRLRPPSSMIRVDYAKSDSPSAYVPTKKGSARSRGSDLVASVVDELAVVENEPEKPAAAYNARGASRRGRKKASGNSTVSDEESAAAPTPAKRSKRSSAAPTAPEVRTLDPPARLEAPVPTTRGRGRRKEATTNSTVNSSGAVSADSNSGRVNGGVGPTVRGRRARGAANTAIDSPLPSSVPRIGNATQSSLESQEIQSILSAAETEASPRSSFRSFARAKGKIESGVEPVGNENPPTSAKKRAGKIAGDQTTIEEFLKPRAAPVLETGSSPRTRGRSSVRGRRVVSSSRAVTQPAKKENAVEEASSKPKRGKKNAAESVPSSEDESMKVSPLRRGRSSIADRSPSLLPATKTRHIILFTGLNDPQLTSAVSNLGGTVTEKPSECTTLVTDKVRRTYKFLCAMAMAVPIVPVEWLKESERRGRFLDTSDFLLQDSVEEAKFNFNLSRSLELARGEKLLEGYTVVLTPNTAPPPSAEMKGIIQACGGKVLVRPPTSWPDKSVVISRQEDVKNAKKFLAKAPSSVPLVSVEFILTGILRHELDFEEHKLEI